MRPTVIATDAFDDSEASSSLTPIASFDEFVEVMRLRNDLEAIPLS